MKSMAFRVTSKFCALAIVPIVALNVLASQGQTKRKKAAHAAKPAVVEPAEQEAAVPFHVGEQLDYRVSWAKSVSAATAHLELAERRGFYRWRAWHFQASAHTVEPLRYFFILDDQFDSYADAATLTSHQYELYLNEQGKQMTRIIRMATDHDLPWGQGPVVMVLPGTRDPLAFFYYLRSVDWQATPEVRSPVYDGTKLYEVRARLAEAATPVTVAAGNYTASRINVQLYQGVKEISDIHFAIWLARDGPRTPVLVEGEIPFATVRGELVKAVQ
jgi:Protein of unknown function (DUF3108)